MFPLTCVQQGLQRDQIHTRYKLNFCQTRKSRTPPLFSLFSAAKTSNIVTSFCYLPYTRSDD